MHIFFYLIPGNHEACSMGTEYRACRILKISLGIISDLLCDLLLILTGFIAIQSTGQMTSASCVGNYLALIVPHFCHRRTSCDHRQLSLGFRPLKGSLHPLDIRHGTSYIFCRNLKPEAVIGFQKNCLRFLEALAHSTVGRLPEISTFRMLLMCPPGEQCNLHIGDG